MLQPTTANAQAALEAVDDELLAHFEGRTHRHSALSAEFSPHGFVSATSTQAALHELIDDLGSGADGASGASHVGTDAIPGTPNPGRWNGRQPAVEPFGPPQRAPRRRYGRPPGQPHQRPGPCLHPDDQRPGPAPRDRRRAFFDDHRPSRTFLRVGADAIEGNPNILAAGSIRDQLAALLVMLNVHVEPFAQAHHASNVAVHDAAQEILAAHVEGALAEIFGAFRADHFGFGEGVLGWHKTLRQPNLGAAGSKALLWDAVGVGGEGGHVRVYLDADAVLCRASASERELR